jgi:hypothetical protein
VRAEEVEGDGRLEAKAKKTRQVKPTNNTNKNHKIKNKIKEHDQPAARLRLNIVPQHVTEKGRNNVHKVLQAISCVVAGQPLTHATGARGKRRGKIMHIPQARNPTATDNDVVRITDD